jgi:hypothetical protein
MEMVAAKRGVRQGETAFDEQHGLSCRREDFGGHPATGTAADHDRVVSDPHLIGSYALDRIGLNRCGAKWHRAETDHFQPDRCVALDRTVVCRGCVEAFPADSTQRCKVRGGTGRIILDFEGGEDRILPLCR